jgi:hypothetical protein
MALATHSLSAAYSSVDTMSSIPTAPADISRTHYATYNFAAVIVLSVFLYGLYLSMKYLNAAQAGAEPQESSTSKPRAKPGRVAVLVLGDVGRSPRMQNHAVSFAKADWQVDLIGFRG